jgi:hypothetical protein
LLLAYLDDVTLAGSAADVAGVAALLENLLGNLGVSLNRSECEWLQRDGVVADGFVAPKAQPGIKILGALATHPDTLPRSGRREERREAVPLFQRQ